MSRKTIYNVHAVHFDKHPDPREQWLIALFYKSCIKFGLSPGKPAAFSIERRFQHPGYQMIHSYWDEPEDAR